ncbi:peptidase T [Conexibacter sp. JD483]|uniref:peptidase T n=1 Tax=unclassified Conexibacter TaxID=2627773 RepID=UPI0027239E00|nr:MULTISPECIES: peptidase T [unclassified Conexibacter]MDO8185382.1 peptidase T [Conexibacter sp. CPCC 205706]MDO8198442.1 peptidase T [Conexibacter sp. CPCC 205762]MDR9368793.1 peptidase T [Conexibacter sp. JD483]
MAAYTSSLAEQLAPDLLDRFLRYVRVSTQSDRDSETTPSSERQRDLSNLLAQELQQLGLADAAVDAGGYVYATLPAQGWNGPEEPPVVGLIAHVDTSPDAPGEGVEPLVHRDYDGGPIALPRNGTVLDPAQMPELRGKQGHDLISSSGDTLLGADDKAGVAEIMAAVAHLVATPEAPCPTLRIGFTVDEEIGRGGLGFDVERFGARCAYTIDGSELGELQDETFTAAQATITIEGIDVHSGFATGKLVNAARLAAQVLAALPSDRLTPETTQGREGFIHPYEISGSPGRATIVAIVRDFEEELLAAHVELLRRTAEEVVAQEPRARLTVEVKRQYPNMRDHLAATPEVVELAELALRAEGLEPIRTPIRGGTDGSLLSARGLPTPNLFTGGHEYHSVREWASLQEMAAAAATIVRLAEAWATPQV